VQRMRSTPIKGYPLLKNITASLKNVKSSLLFTSVVHIYGRVRLGSGMLKGNRFDSNSYKCYKNYSLDF